MKSLPAVSMSLGLLAASGSAAACSFKTDTEAPMAPIVTADTSTPSTPIVTTDEKADDKG